jgi:hypothetical protein
MVLLASETAQADNVEAALVVVAACAIAKAYAAVQSMVNMTATQDKMLLTICKISKRSE